MKWSILWEREAGEGITPGPKVFLIDQYLPVWVQCTLPECRKWRKLPPAIDLHHVSQEMVKCSSCQVPQDEVGGSGVSCDLIDIVEGRIEGWGIHYTVYCGHLELFMGMTQPTLLYIPLISLSASN